MKKLLLALFPYPWYLSLVCTWLFTTGLYVLAILYWDFFFWISFPFAPVNVEIAVFTYGCFAMFSHKPEEYFNVALFLCGIPLVTIILILGGDWAMHKVKILRKTRKLLFNLAYLLLLSALIQMTMWQSWKPWIIFTHPRFGL